MTAECTLKVSNPAELIAAVPYLIGFHPADSVTVIALRGKKIIFAARHDLPERELPGDVVRSDAAEVAAVVAGQGVTGATVIGYGEPARVTPTVLRVAEALIRAGVPVLDELRVTGGRYWSYLCSDPECCPQDGRPCLPADSAIAAAATYQGAVALPDRKALVDQIAPACGAEQRAAATRAQRRMAVLYDRESHEAGFVRQVRRAGRAAVREAERRYRSGKRLTDDEVAWLGLLLMHIPVRDYAWERMGDERWWVGLWTDVLRRVEPMCVPAPACLLSFAAWRAGHGALARVAVDRAFAEDPLYGMASLLGDLLKLGVHPRAVAGWPDVEPLAAEGVVGGLVADAFAIDLEPSPCGRPSGDGDLSPAGGPQTGTPAWRIEVPRAGRAVVDERLGRRRSRPKRRGYRRRAL